MAKIEFFSEQNRPLFNNFFLLLAYGRGKIQQLDVFVRSYFLIHVLVRVTVAGKC